jgi:hypothetical protein
MSGDISDQHEELLRHLRGIQYIAIAKTSEGFRLSQSAKLKYLDRTGTKYELIDQPDREKQIKFGPRIFVKKQEFNEWNIDRDDPALISILKEMGNSAFANDNVEIKIVEVPADVRWIIQMNIHGEWVAEAHRIWE